MPNDLITQLFCKNEGFGVLMAAIIGVPLYISGGTIPLLLNMNLSLTTFHKKLQNNILLKIAKSFSKQIEAANVFCIRLVADAHGNRLVAVQHKVLM